jgi:hypothetical protein
MTPTFGHVGVAQRGCPAFIARLIEVEADDRCAPEGGRWQYQSSADQRSMSWSR